MRLAKKYSVPPALTLLYEFVNSLDVRQYVEQGEQHATHDELATARQLRQWLRARGLLRGDARVGAREHRAALKLRAALRQFIQVPPEDRPRERLAAAKLNEISSEFPLAVTACADGEPTFQPAPGASGLAHVLRELGLLAAAGQLNRLKMCSSDECHWIFYDRSKHGNRRLCLSALCGNRHKTRSYRARRREADLDP